MAYVLPTFNLTAGVWHYATYFGNFPTIVPPADFTVSCNLALGKRGAGGFVSTMYLLLPPGTDGRDHLKNPALTAHGDIVEVPFLSSRYYQVVVVDDIGKGFANEHRVCTLEVNPAIYPL